MKKRKNVQSLMEALALIEDNWGTEAGRLVSGHPALTPKVVMELAGRSPEYQQHVLGRIRAGHARPLDKTAASVLVYETVGFYEVPSRMHRALGNVRHEAAYVAKHVSADTPILDRGADRLLTLALVIETAEKIAAHIGRLQVAGEAHFDKRGKKKPALPDKLHAAGALGLLAKNARDLPHLKPEHLPTAEQRVQALRLCEEIITLAKPALGSARKKWGHLDAQLRVRPAGTVTRRIITHANPGGDALVAAWLAERYMFGDESVEILFVPRSRVLGCLRIGDCLVDVGNTLDPARHLLDHKPPALPSRHDNCAAGLVWEHLLANGKAVKHLEDLVLAVFAWDSVKRRQEFATQATASKRNGFHAALDAAKQKGLNNAALYRQLRQWLNNSHPGNE